LPSLLAVPPEHLQQALLPTQLKLSAAAKQTKRWLSFLQRRRLKQLRSPRNARRRLRSAKPRKSALPPRRRRPLRPVLLGRLLKQRSRLLVKLRALQSVNRIVRRRLQQLPQPLKLRVSASLRRLLSDRL
jgi:hypothetical protein